jgi:hypothetical protein
MGLEEIPFAGSANIDFWVLRSRRDQPEPRLNPSCSASPQRRELGRQHKTLTCISRKNLPATALRTPAGAERGSASQPHTAPLMPVSRRHLAPGQLKFTTSSVVRHECPYFPAPP